jgi:hypothetical protein
MNSSVWAAQGSNERIFATFACVFLTFCGQKKELKKIVESALKS